ncbi:hypothetical protein DPMN_129200 [Dreissena polymorpha]|uniref:Uncharacterized protein n=1 Tax=Dreissena polymorpha TaxID=45954 RepID=A0A9D4JY23_DREPO|nr:hypothetical protein DPMN_129200 [Dreissena polymorpha]
MPLISHQPQTAQHAQRDQTCPHWQAKSLWTVASSCFWTLSSVCVRRARSA